MRQPFESREHQQAVRLRADAGPDAAIRLLAEQQRAQQPRHRRLRPAGARVHAGQQQLHVSRARSRTDRAAVLHQYADDDDVAELRVELGHRGADDHRAGLVQQRRRAAGRPRERQEPDVRVGSGLRPRHPFLARRRPDLRRLVSRQSATTTTSAPTCSATSPRTRRARRSSTRAASAIPSLQLLPRAHRRVLPGRHPRQEGSDAEPRRPLQLPDARCPTERRSSRASG